MTIEAQARDLLADAIAAKGSAWANTAHSVRSGRYGNEWTSAALVAIGQALRTGPDDEDDQAP